MVGGANVMELYNYVNEADNRDTVKNMIYSVLQNIKTNTTEDSIKFTIPDNYCRNQDINSKDMSMCELLFITYFGPLKQKDLLSKIKNFNDSGYFKNIPFDEIYKKITYDDTGITIEIAKNVESEKLKNLHSEITKTIEQNINDMSEQKTLSKNDHQLFSLKVILEINKIIQENNNNTDQYGGFIFPIVLISLIVLLGISSLIYIYKHQNPEVEGDERFLAGIMSKFNKFRSKKKKVSPKSNNNENKEN